MRPFIAGCLLGVIEPQHRIYISGKIPLRPLQLYGCIQLSLKNTLCLFDDILGDSFAHGYLLFVIVEIHVVNINKINIIR